MADVSLQNVAPSRLAVVCGTEIEFTCAARSELISDIPNWTASKCCLFCEHLFVFKPF